MRNIRRCLIVIALLAMPASIDACLWDYDTLRQERSRFPSTLEVITGKFLRHSPEFYEWRVQDRTKKLETDPNNLAYLDDLAVAYHKLGQHNKAIEIMQCKDKISPNLYETEANISTFYFFAGDLQKSLFHVNKALAINPNAHFGREKYQKYLIEWIIFERSRITWIPQIPISFAEFLKKYDREPEISKNLSKRQEAIKAVLGMMRFADHKSPVLLDALGSLLCSTKLEGEDPNLSLIEQDDMKIDAKKLAARAFIRAALESQSETDKKAFIKKASIAFVQDSARELPEIESRIAETQQHFDNELNDAETWYAKLREDEIRWIREGNDVDAEFDKKYYKEPKNQTTESSPMLSDPNDMIKAALTVVGVGFVVFVILVGLLVRHSIKKNRARRLLTQSHSELNPRQEGA